MSDAAKTEKRGRGRQAQDEPFDDKQAKFLQLIIDGGTWNSARRDLRIGNSTITRWLREDEEFREQYARAIDIRADTIFEEILEIADDGSNDWMQRHFGDDVRWVENGEAIRRSALRIDARKWMLGKMKPKVYGDKQHLEHSGSVGIRHEDALAQLASE